MLTKKEQRLRRSRQTRIRIATQGVARLTVNRTNLHIYATVISEDGSKVLATASTAQADLRKSLGGSRRWHSTAQVLRTTAASRRWPKRPAKPACSSNGHGKTSWQEFRQSPKVTVPKTGCARR
jgi:ribosomal protein L18